MLFFPSSLPEQEPQRAAMTDAYRMDETACVGALLDYLGYDIEVEGKIANLATDLVQYVRQYATERSGVEALMVHYDLSTEEGIVLMCLAEALLRVPDKETEDLLIKDKLTSANWRRHLGASESSFVNLATWGLSFTGKLLQNKSRSTFGKVWHNLVRRSGEPVIRQAVRAAIKVMSEHFVLGRNIEEALKRSEPVEKEGFCFSYDMLGEVARTQEDADKYFAAYRYAIEKIGQFHQSSNIFKGPSISVKLSALYPRYEFAKREVAIPVLTERLRELALQAKLANLSLTVDAEEADRLELSLDIIKNVFADPTLGEWQGFGLAIQAYQKRAFPLISWLVELARQYGKRLQVRLVKGAYWDTEIKLSQVGGYSDYPVFTRKNSTDVSYLACAKQLLAAQDAIYPQFATHNAYSVAAILTMMGDPQKYDFEFQKLQGMGKSLHDYLVDPKHFNITCRTYAPVGSHEDLLPYLVRRLLENGANSSFVNQIADENVPIADLIASPVVKTKNLQLIPHPKIPLPKNIYGVERLNSHGVDFSHHQELQQLTQAMQPFVAAQWEAGVANAKRDSQLVLNPADRRDEVGKVYEADDAEIEEALDRVSCEFPQWDDLGVSCRADILDKMADLLEAHRAELMLLTSREAGKVMSDALAEVREAVDFCRYYAMMARTHLSVKAMPGPTGETNELRMRGRGVMLCISPWNFPIAIFTGQVAASLVAGNTVIAKPAEQTPLVAARVIELFYQAGVPRNALRLLVGKGETVGAKLVADERIQGVLFTGSTATAKHIQKTLAAREGAIVPLIAETGGINAMITDSTALPEQLIRDVLISAFGSAGQRCSALRLLLIQDDVADRVIKMLQGAMAELTVGDPRLLATDVGPVIDADAQKMLLDHAAAMQNSAKLLYRVELGAAAQHGYFVAPQAFELQSISELKREVFGPILHVVRYARKNLDAVIDEINGLGYGLTFGIQSRINDTVDYIQSRMRVGNIYVNRNMIGAVVGVQPFGGNGLSGTGPKAGGPHYLSKLCHENTLTVDTTAAGGNASLMALD